ncbi:MAG: UDP-N-acetylmuramoyl-L-alanine--D-glutamate ligase [Motiliproteus sp.]|nr:UDP-N-acetylmuramoyl-L-alanine--D-glutamate ligase [Motiliproteus sp.]MCW9051700.1 UDP-N-acetylmuramoyl-L-alanine--D-glutamate ligase [Motiliproteus sp.]
MALIGSDKFTIVIGLGKTGLSCARFLTSIGERFAVVDTRNEPPLLSVFKEQFPDIAVECGELEVDTLCRASRLLISPGVSRKHPAIQAAEQQGVEILGDIDLFCLQVSAPIVAITGSNAKSTVTTLLGAMAEQAGINVGVGGNLGTPVLDMLLEGEKSLYVLELSSFQLETTSQLRAAAATVLNVSPDHMDRYPDLMAYHQAKHRIYQGCKFAVFNGDDALTQPLIADQIPRRRFSLGKPDLNQFGVLSEEGAEYLACGVDKLLPVGSLKMAGRHNVANALAALALGQAVNIPMVSMLKTLQSYSGLAHRCQWVRELEGINYYNDSKGTNVGATLAAIQGFGEHQSGQGQIILIAGGDGKGADFSELRPAMGRWGKAAVLIGRDRDAIADALQSDCSIYLEETLAAAVNQARDIAQAGDIVLLSPACASFDMFKGFEDRGDQFMALVEDLR